MHMNIHYGIRPFACQTCGKRFNNRGARYNHMKMHSNAFPYECPLCQKAFHWELSLKQHLKSHAKRGDIMDIMVDTIYGKQIEQQKLKKKQEKKRQLNQIRLQQSSLVNSERVSQPVVKNENSQEVAACSPNTTSTANTPNTANPRSPIHQPQPSVHATVGLGQNEHSGNNETHSYHGTDKMIKAENTAENQICGVNMPSVAHQAFQNTAVYNPYIISIGRPSNAIPRPPLPTIVGLRGNNEGTSTNASLSFKQPIQDAATMIGKPQDNQSRF
ncbi:Zinc finger and BTB domain-containing protein 43 [Trichinella nativa]|uniref:Zinc finger and BTB domain-containing protein 43 n=1 Tax=Trichinella nativa TaxID=6335 RepID=A0A0V1L4N6_9BILA|nr:Zinc finger and BTB domain-containing protein 43 [Trichinella nativa]